MIITKKDSIHYDQIKGNDINGFFDKNELKTCVMVMVSILYIG